MKRLLLLAFTGIALAQQPVVIKDTSGNAIGSNSNALLVYLNASGITLPVSGTFWQTTQPVSQSGTWTVQPGNTPNSTAWLVTGTGGTFPVTGTFWQTTQPVSWTSQSVSLTGAWPYSGALGSVSVTGNVSSNIAQVLGSAISATNPMFASITDGTHQMGTMTAFGSTPSTAYALNANVSLFQGTTAIGSGAPLQVTLANTGANTNKLLVTADPITFASAQAVTQSGTWTDRIVGNGGATLDAAPGSAPTNAVAVQGVASMTPVQITQSYPPGLTTALSAPVVINATGSVQIVTGTAAKQTYITFLQFAINGTADNIALVEGTGTTCGASTTGMAGGSTAATGWNLLANGSVTSSNGGWWVFKTATTGDNVCLLASSGAQISGVVIYAQQ